MPFQSPEQRRFMFWKHPAIAKRWAREEKEGGYKEAAKRRLKGRHRRVTKSPDEDEHDYRD